MFKRIPWHTGLPSHISSTQQRSAIFVGMGTNIGSSAEKRRIMTLALHHMRITPATRLLATSSLYETPPWGDLDQPDFTNAVVAIKSQLSPLDLLRHLKRIEKRLGRQKRRRWGPREIDLDILLYGQVIIDLPQLRIPHPHMAQRAFVTVPLQEIGGSLTFYRYRMNGGIPI